MKQRIGIFSILIITLILFSPAVLAGAGDINVPPTNNPPFVEPVPDGILDKINQYVIDYSGISKDYFNAHYEVLNAYKTTYDCIPGECKGAGCFNTYNLECNHTYAVHVLWNFKIDDYTAIVGDQSGVSIYVEEPSRFIFIIENDEVKEHWRYIYINQVLQNRPFPKFREITNLIPQTQLKNIKDSCGTFTRPNAIKLTTDSVYGNDLSLVFYSWGKKDGKDVELLVNLENGESQCNEIQLVGGQKTGVIPSTNYTNLILIIVGIIVVLLVIIGIYKKFKK